jgi:hypothetical protein
MSVDLMSILPASSAAYGSGLKSHQAGPEGDEHQNVHDVDVLLAPRDDVGHVLKSVAVHRGVERARQIAHVGDHPRVVETELVVLDLRLVSPVRPSLLAVDVKGEPV